VKQYNGCERFSKHRHTPAAALKTIPLNWPFALWGLDMVGPFKTAPKGLTHLLVAVDKFTKWIEAKPIKKLNGSSTIKFFNEIIVRYGVPHSIITDIGTNFAKGIFAEFCSQKGIRLDLASVAHPQSNGASAEFLEDLFHLPLSQEAHSEFVAFEDICNSAVMIIAQGNLDSWCYIWGSQNFVCSKAYKVLSGHQPPPPHFA
jgi:hypothetical protein